MKKPLVLFDLDGTLIDSSAWLVGAVNRALGEHLERPFTFEDLMATAGGPEHQVFARFLPVTSVDEGLRRYRRELEAPGSLRVHDGIESMLESLAADARLGIFTGAGRELGELRLSLTGLDRFFDIRVYGDEVEPKPSAEGLRVAAEKAGVPLTQLVFVGDTEKDALSAAAAGVAFIGVSWGDTPGGPPNCTVAISPTELGTIVRRLPGGSFPT